MTIVVERTDFISVPVTDPERSRRFYGESLGLPLVVGDDAWPEYQLGENVSLYLIDPTNIGREFEGPHTSSRERRSTRACATWRSSATRTATR